MRHIVLFSIVIAVCAAGNAGAQQSFKPGDMCLAYWEPDGLYYMGTVVETDRTIKGGGYFVVFADGDQAKVPAARVRPLAIKEGSKVLARWSDKSFYPGTVAEIRGGALFIHFDDGDKGWTSWAGVALKLD